MGTDGARSSRCATNRGRRSGRWHRPLHVRGGERILGEEASNEGREEEDYVPVDVAAEQNH